MCTTVLAACMNEGGWCFREKMPAADRPLVLLEWFYLCCIPESNFVCLLT